MTRRIVIENVTRIEGHAKITLHLNEKGEVSEARFHVTQFRGFEKFCEGRPFYEMPALMARICGICPVAHLIASAKACDALLAVRIPPSAANLRRVLNYAQIIQSHALSFFHLSAPDLLLGMDADPATRNLFGLLDSHPDIARDGVRLRKFGQEIIEALGGKRIHPGWVVPGGVSEPLKPNQRDEILKNVPEALRIVERALDLFKRVADNFTAEIESFGNFPSLFMGLVNADGDSEYYDGNLRMVDADGKTVLSCFPPQRYADIIGERVEPWSYLKSPYYILRGYPKGMYRVGPLARLNVVEACGTPRADQELEIFRGGPGKRTMVTSSFQYHYARLIEILCVIEKMQMKLADPEILSKHVRAHAQPNSFEGVGVAEAPRGLLIHHYHIDEDGLIRNANLIIATGHNNLAMNQAVLQTARRFVRGDKLEEGMLNRVEAVIRAYDPCLSCSTHAIGRMPLEIELLNGEGRVVDALRRALS